jgi:predicted AAA+ superfamily ATPase
MYTRSINIPKNNSFFLFGARGTGKTSLLKQHFGTDNSLYIDLLIASDYLRFSSNRDEFLHVCRAAKEKWIIVDEVQKIPGLLDAVHHLIEEHGKLFALTGSSARKLRRGGANLLAGRAFVLELHPLTHIEIGEKFDLGMALEWGSLPKIFSLENKEDRKRFLDSYSLTYIKEEISAEQIVRKLDPFVRFLEIAAQSNTLVVNFSKIAQDCGSSAKVVQSYFEILEDTLLGYFLPPYHQSIRKRQRTAPKFYFFDIGVVRSLSRSLHVPVQSGTYYYGKYFEHFIITEIKRLSSYAENRFSLSYLRTKDDAEIDLIVERPGMPLAIVEIKSSANVNERDVSSLARFAPEFKGAEIICLSQDPRPKKIGLVDVEPWQQGIRRILGE